MNAFEQLAIANGVLMQTQQHACGTSPQYMCESKTATLFSIDTQG